MTQIMQELTEPGHCSLECHVFHDQTQLVGALFKIDSWADEKQRLVLDELDELRETNRFMYAFNTGTCEIEVAETAYFQRLDKWRQRLDDLQKTAKERYLTYAQNKAAADEQAELNRRILCYEAAESIKRQVYSWWLVPYWLGDRLIEEGETVLRSYGCTWWGITSPSIMHPSTSEVLDTIFSTINTSQPKAPFR